MHLPGAGLPGDLPGWTCSSPRGGDRVQRGEHHPRLHRPQPLSQHDACRRAWTSGTWCSRIIELGVECMRTVHRHPAARCLTVPWCWSTAAHPLAETAAPDLAAPDERYPDILLERRAARLLAACIQAVGGGAGNRARSPAGAARRSSRPSGTTPWRKRERRSPGSMWRFPGAASTRRGLAIDLGRAARAHRLHPARLSRGRRLRAASGDWRPRYGFIQRYHREKEALTGIACEPWHYPVCGDASRPADGAGRACAWRSIWTGCRQRPRTCRLEHGRQRPGVLHALRRRGDGGSACRRAAARSPATTRNGFVVTVWEAVGMADGRRGAALDRLPSGWR